MISRTELEKRVNARRQEIDAQNAKFAEMKAKINDFVGDVKNRSVIYNLLKNLSVWKELENLVGNREESES